MTRKMALETIKIEYAQHGQATREATRAYVEHRLSMKAYQEAAQQGLEIYQAQKGGA